MKHLFLFCLIAFPGTVGAQYFNIFPNINSATGTGEYHYVVSGAAIFPDSLPLVLNVELLTPNEELNLITDRVYDLSDTATFTGLTIDAENNLFTVDIGSYAGVDYLLHMWIGIGSERFDEIYYQQP